MTVKELIEKSILNAEATIDIATDMLTLRSSQDEDYDTLVQIVKDNRTFIHDQLWTLGLMEGMPL